MFFLDPRERDTKQLAKGIVARTFWGERMLMAVVDLEPNTILPVHRHPHEQVGLVLEGELEMQIGDQEETLGPGKIYVIPGGKAHGGKTTQSGARVLDVFSPVREEYKY